MTDGQAEVYGRDSAAAPDEHDVYDGCGIASAATIDAGLARLADAGPPPAEIALSEAAAAAGGGAPKRPQFSAHHFASVGDAKPPQSVVDGGGIKMVDPQVQLIFWGAEWVGASPPTSPQAIEAAVKTLCLSAYFEPLREYKWFDKITLLGAHFASTTEPPAQFVRADVQNLVTGLIGAGSVPKPNSGNFFDFIYCVLMPSTTSYKPGGLNGEHSVASWKDPATNQTERPYVAWILNGSLDQMTTTISHELAETITDPRGDGIQLAPASPTSWNEIGDVCSSVAYLHGVAVQSYWSQNFGACVIAQSHADSLVQTVPSGTALQVIATQLNWSRALRRFWIGQIRASDGAGNTYDLSRGEAASLIDSGANTFFVIGTDGSRADVEVGVTEDGHAYLHTHRDATTADNLLSLPHFN
jgi:Protein of unknown function (DUF3892)